MRMCSCRGTAGFAHVSCLAEEAKILVAEALENNLGSKVLTERFQRWDTCSLCEQDYHGVVRCALGWACWKTYLGRPEKDQLRAGAMRKLGSGLSATNQHEAALSVKEAELSMRRRLGDSEETILTVRNNLAGTYKMLGRQESALNIYRDVYSGYARLHGEEHGMTLLAASNYANSLFLLERCEEGKALLRKTMPVARRVLGESDKVTLRMRSNYATALYTDPSARLDDLRDAVTTLEEVDQIARRVLGGAHPVTKAIELALEESRKNVQN